MELVCIEMLLPVFTHTMASLCKALHSPFICLIHTHPSSFHVNTATSGFPWTRLWSLGNALLAHVLNSKQGSIHLILFVQYLVSLLNSKLHVDKSKTCLPCLHSLPSMAQLSVELWIEINSSFFPSSNYLVFFFFFQKLSLNAWSTVAEIKL